MCAVSIAGVTVQTMSRLMFSFDISNVIVAFCIGVLGNLYARRFKDIALATILSAILFLVPGAIGVVGFYNMLASETSASGASFAVDVTYRAMSIALGLYLSMIMVFPMQRLLL